MLSSAVERDTQLKIFIAQCFDIGNTEITKIQGDAGFRSYFRLTNSGSSYILMDCPTWYCSVEPFIKVANHLKQHNISAPRILKQNIHEGFLLLEDFGNLSIKSYIENRFFSEKLITSSLIPQAINYHLDEFKGKSIGDRKLYEDKPNSQNPSELYNVSDGIKSVYYLIMDLLIQIQSLPTSPDLPIYTNDLMISELELFTSWYIPYKTGKKLSKKQFLNFKEIWNKTLLKQKEFPFTTVHRDFHSENMMYLPERQGINMLGILDFQDALIGSPIYDLVSVLEDARISVARDLALDCIEYYAKKKNLDTESVLLNYHILGAQRNSRILGIFARKFIRDKTDQYLKYIPLVLEYLKQDLSHPKLDELKTYINNMI